MQQWTSGLCWPDIYYSCIHKEGMQRGNEQIFPFLLFYFTHGGAEILPISPSHTVLTHKHTTRTMKSRSSSIYWPAGSPAQSGDVPALLANEWEWMNANNRRRVHCCSAVSFGEIIKDRRWQWWWLNTLCPNQVRCIIPDALETVCISAQHLAGIVFQS